MDEEEAKLNIADIYARIGDSAQALRLTKEAYAINDSMQVLLAVSNAQELEAVYQNQTKTEKISHLRLWVAILAFILAIIVAVLLSYRIRIVRKRKDKTIAAVVRDMVEHKEEKEKSETPDAATPASEQTRFSAFDAVVNQGHLYAKPDVTRDVLVELMGVDSNTFSRIIREQSGCQNLNDYLNRKRIDYACLLMQQHPNYTVETIAQDCGFLSIRTFNRVFKSIREITPSQYLDSLETP